MGGDEPSAAEIERFVRRLHLDLSGTPPTESYLTDAMAGLKASNQAKNRAALADGLIADDSFAGVYVGELGNRAFGGESLNSRYDLLCAITRGNNPECMECAPASDPCTGCECEAVEVLESERDQLALSADTLANNSATTSEIERNYAASAAFRGLSNPTGLASALFESFLGRPAEGEELDNAAAMIIGALLPETPAGLLFHRHGSSYDDLLDIVFESEVYREAAVSGVFLRYLGRLPSQAESSHFSAQFDALAPDIRPVIRAVVSSREYFEQ